MASNNLHIQYVTRYYGCSTLQTTDTRHVLPMCSEEVLPMCPVGDKRTGGCMHKFRTPIWVLAALFLAPFAARSAAHTEFTLSQVLHYPYATQLATAEQG